jgi:hypothetical protein
MGHKFAGFPLLGRKSGLLGAARDLVIYGMKQPSVRNKGQNTVKNGKLPYFTIPTRG